jgi:formylglycine-generating enzyme required for sulfatase activity
MKYSFVFLLPIAVVLIAAKTPKPPKLHKSLKKKYSFVPSGFVKVDKDTFFLQAFYMQNHEVSNEEYNLYLQSLQKENATDALEMSRIKNENWENQENAKAYAEHYHVHPAYAKYPVVNVSYQGALGYCDYMTKKLNELFRKTGIQLKARLPFDIEITRAGIGDNHGRVYPWEDGGVLNKKGEPLCNHKVNSNKMTVHSKKGGAGPLASVDCLAPVISYLPSAFGLYNLSGNAAEMTNVPGVTVGGSFKDAGSDVKLTSKSAYTDASCHVGFRVVFTWQAE